MPQIYNPQYQTPYYPSQPVYQPIQPMQQQYQPQIWVSGKAEADQYQIAPNTTIPLWDRNEQVIYLKSADQSGKYSMDILEYHSKNEEQKSKHEGITREEFQNTIDWLSRQINSIRSNMKNPNNANYQGGGANG
jgi:hypothetical protein